MVTAIPTPPYDGSQKLPQQQQQQQAPQASRKSSNSSTSSTSGVVPSSRTAKSGNGSGSNATASHTHSTHQHHHNSHRASKRSGTTPTASHSHSHSHHAASSGSHHSSSVSATAAAAAAAAVTHSHGSPHHDGDGRHKRVWKACERCRMKKTKCDGEFPCKRCKDDGLVCTAGTRKKTEYKQLPKGYAEVLENTQFALVATVHKLYAMVRAANAWELGEPELNERGQPVIHSIASKLGCIRPNNDPDLPMGPSVFPETEQDMAQLASQLEEQQKKREAEQAATAAATAAAESQQQKDASAIKTEVTATATTAAIPISLSTSIPNATTTAMLASNSSNGAFDFNLGGRFDRASSSEDYDGFSDMDDYRKNVFGSGNGNGNGSSVNSASTTMSPQSLSFADFEVGSNQSDGFAAPSPTMPTTQYTNWMTQPGNIDLSNQQAFQLHVLQQQQLQLQQNQMHKKQALQQHEQYQKRLQQQQQRQQQQQQQQQQHQQTQNLKQAPLALSIPTTMATPSMPMNNDNLTFFSPQLITQSLVDGNFGALKAHLNQCPDVMLGTGDPMIYNGGEYEDTMF